MPEKEGAEEKSTKSVVNKKQKQMMGEEGYDHLRDQGRIRKNKKKKDATTLPVSDEVKKTQKVNKGPSALERVKADIEKRYGKDAIMKINKEKTVSEEGKSLLSTPGLDKLKKIQNFKSNADRVFGRKSPNLTKVAESFGGQIVGEPVELDEIAPALAIPYLIGGGIATIGAVGYDSWQKMRGKKGILPDLSGIVKKVYDKTTGVFKSQTADDRRTDGGSDTGGTTGGTRGRKIRKKYNTNTNQNQNKNQNQNNKNNKNNNKNLEPPEVKGDPLKINYGTYNKGAKGDKTKNVFSKIKDIVVGKNKTGQLLRTAGVSGTTATGVTTALKNRRGFRLPRPRVPDGGHVGRRTAG